MDVYANESVPCPACKSRLKRILMNSGKAANGSFRSECEGCRRFWGWVSPAAVAAMRAEKSQAGGAGEVPPATPSEPLATAAEPAASPGERLANPPPEAWVYVSKRLDLEWVPNAPLWASPVIRFGTTWFYRLTPAVLAWLDAAGRQLEDAVLAGKVERGQLDAYLAVMELVWRFSDQAFAAGEMAAARAVPPKLPEVPAVPAA